MRTKLVCAQNEKIYGSFIHWSQMLCINSDLFSFSRHGQLTEYCKLWKPLYAPHNESTCEIVYPSCGLKFCSPFYILYIFNWISRKSVKRRENRPSVKMKFKMFHFYNSFSICSLLLETLFMPFEVELWI